MDGTVRVLEVDPDLGNGLDPEAFADARAALVAPAVAADRGAWDLAATWAATGAQLGLLMTAGVLARDVGVGRRVSLEILGPGDLVRPWPPDRHAQGLDFQLRFDVLESVRFAALDDAFAVAAARWPSVLGQVAGRVMGRATSASLRLLIHQVVRIDDRVLLSLWGLAERPSVPGGPFSPIRLFSRLKPSSIRHRRR